MNVLHLNAGNETGGGMFHILSLLGQLKDTGNITLGLFSEGEMAKRAREKNIHVVIFKQKHQFDISIINQIKQYVIKNKIDIIHSHGPRANVISYMLKRKVNFIWYTTVHSNPLDDFIGYGLKGRFFTRLNVFAIKSADQILAISERFRTNLIKLGADKKKICTILNGIDFNVCPKRAYSREEFQLSKDDFVIMMVARLEPVKHHETAIEAMEQLVKLSSKFQLVLIGDGSRMDELQSMVKEKGLTKNVKFFGYRKDIPELLELCDISLLTSKSESFPLVLLEAARAKKTVVTTDVGGIQSLIPNENYGRIINVGDVENLVKQISDLYELKQKGKLKEMGENLYLHARTNFSLESFANSVRKTYKKTS
jgi:L-malate glycosyltransferase